MKDSATSYILIICFSLSLCSCNKSKLPAAVLPEATQQGKNTIGFKLNDAVWVPFATCGFSASPCREVSARYSSPASAPRGIDFSFSRIRNDKQSSLLISSPFATITSVGEKVDSIGVIFLSENMTGNDGYFTGPLNGSKFTITKIDFSAQIISGEFEFILLEQNGSGNKIALKDGRFDLRFNACRCSN